MAFSSSPQLYIFCIVQFLYSLCSLTFIPLWFDVCQMLFGKKCNPNEDFLLNLLGFMMLFATTAIFTLTVLNGNDAAKLKRLAFIALYCVSAQLAGAMLAGSQHLGGLMPKGWHIAEVAVQFILFFILATAVWTDSAASAPSDPIWSSIGLNIKGFVTLYTIFILLWIFANGDIQEYADVLVDTSKITHLTRFLWFAWSIYCFEAFLAFGFGVAYGDEKDNVALTYIAIVFTVLNIPLEFIFKDTITADILRTCVIQGIVVGAVGVVALIWHRIQKRGNYEPVSDTVV